MSLNERVKAVSATEGTPDGQGSSQFLMAEGQNARACLNQYTMADEPLQHSHVALERQPRHRLGPRFVQPLGHRRQGVKRSIAEERVLSDHFLEEPFVEVISRCNRRNR